MTTAWKTQHRRSAAIREVLTRVERSRDGELPWEAVPAAVAVFEEPGGLLRALQHTWCTRLAAALDLAADTGGTDPAESAQFAWYDLAWRYPGLRRVLDRHAAHPEVIPGRTQEHRMLAVFGGRARLDEPATVAAARGRRLVLGLRPAESVA